MNISKKSIKLVLESMEDMILNNLELDEEAGCETFGEWCQDGECFYNIEDNSENEIKEQVELMKIFFFFSNKLSKKFYDLCNEKQNVLSNEDEEEESL